MLTRVRQLRQGRWKEYEVLRRKFELDNEVGSVGRSKNKIEARNEKDWEKEVYTKSTLKWYTLAKIVQEWRGV